MYNILEKAEELYNAQNYVEAFNSFLSEANQGNAYAQYRIGLMYEFGEGTKKKSSAAFKYIKQSADAGNIDAISQLGYYYSIGFGCKKNSYEAAQCFKHAAESGDALALDNYGVSLLSGEGIMRSISSARRAFKQSADLGEERGKEHLKQLEGLYAFNSSGKIDLSASKNSKMAVFITILLLIINIFFVATSLMSYTKLGSGFILIQTVLPIAYIVAVFLLLLKLKAGGYILYTLMVIPFIAFPMIMSFGVDTASYIPDSPNMPPSASGSYSLISSSTGIFSILTYLILQKKRHGIPTWNRLMKHPFDGDRQIKEWMYGLIQYGDTSSYRQDAPETKRFRIIYLSLVAIMVICSVLCSYFIITTDGLLDIHLNWNFFSSSFAMPLCIVGFFLGLKIRTNPYTTYNVYKDPNTGKEKKREKSEDMTDVIEGKILMPLLQRFLIIPVVTGAMIYYLVLICLSIFGLVFPYVLSILIVYSTFFLYKRYHLFTGRKYRIALSLGTCLFLLGVYATAYQCWKNALTPSANRMVATTQADVTYTPLPEGTATAESNAPSNQENAVSPKTYDESAYYDQEMVLTGKGIGSFRFNVYSYAAIPTSFEGLYTHFEREEYVDEHDGINGLYKFYDNSTLVMQHYVYDPGNGKIDRLEVFSPKIGTALGLKTGISAKELLNYEVTFEDSDPMNIVYVGNYQLKVKGFSNSFAEKYQKWYMGEISRLTLNASDFDDVAIIESISH